jgi:flagellar protein FliO/FliZ
LTIIFALWTFILPIIGISAQEEPVPVPSVEATDQTSAPDTTVVISETLEADPITIAERALPLGGGTEGVAVSPAPVGALSILRVIITLILAAVAIYGLVAFVKRFSRGGPAHDPFLKVLASTSLGTNRGVHILSVGSQAWLVGSAESGVSLISEIQDKEALDTMLLEDSRRTAESVAGSTGRFPDFKAMLRRLGMPVDSGAPPGPEDIRKRGERLKGL